MAVTKNTQYGNINISKDALAMLAGGLVNECYGVVGMASQKFVKDGWAELLKKENFAKGIIVNDEDDKLILDVYVIISHGVKIAEVVKEVQAKLKYELEKTLDLSITAINVYVQGIENVK